jgi:hypothetical protein
MWKTSQFVMTHLGLNLLSYFKISYIKVQSFRFWYHVICHEDINCVGQRSVKPVQITGARGPTLSHTRMSLSVVWLAVNIQINPYRPSSKSLCNWLQFLLIHRKIFCRSPLVGRGVPEKQISSGHEPAPSGPGYTGVQKLIPWFEKPAYWRKRKFK